MPLWKGGGVSLVLLKMIRRLVRTVYPLLLVAVVRDQLLGLKPESNLVLGCLWAMAPVDDVSDVQVTEREQNGIILGVGIQEIQNRIYVRFCFAITHQRLKTEEKWTSGYSDSEKCRQCRPELENR
jgi:hypothetical protein